METFALIIGNKFAFKLLLMKQGNNKNKIYKKIKRYFTEGQLEIGSSHQGFTPDNRKIYSQ